MSERHSFLHYNAYIRTYIHKDYCVCTIKCAQDQSLCFRLTWSRRHHHHHRHVMPRFYTLSFSIYSQLLRKSKKPTPRRCFLPVCDSMKICNGTRNWNWLKFPKYGMAHAISSYLNAIVNLELLKIIVE